MPLVVHALRLCYISLNVYETFKTVKLPPPSTRNGGQSSTRALSQRKRAMKGCMAVWMVWCCFALYERFMDGVIRIFIPFYDELKSLVLLFFLITRARGAEPIYLHCLRPIIKPHAATLDAALDFVTSFGDLVLLLCAMPIEFVRGIYGQWFPSSRRTAPSTVDGAKAAAAPVRPTMADQSRFSSTRSEQSVRSTDSGYASGAPPAEAHLSKSQKLPPNSSIPQVWYPPQSAYNDVDASYVDTPPPYSTAAGYGADAEWKQYPAFPSAYPATPMPSSREMTGDINMPVPMHHAAYPQVPGAQDEPDFIPPHPQTISRQDFRMSLRLPRESSNPDSAGGLSDDDETNGIQSDHDVIMTAASEDSSEDEDDDLEEEDSFDITLRTPAPLRVRKEHLKAPTIILPSLSSDSRISRSTTLSTTDNGSSLRTRTNSEVSSAPSEVPFVAGKKRPVQGSEEEDLETRKTLAAKPASRPSTTTAARRPTRILPITKTASESSAGDENVALKGNARPVSSTALKKRKVSVATAPAKGRPVPKLTDEAPSKTAKPTRAPRTKIAFPKDPSQLSSGDTQATNPVLT